MSESFKKEIDQLSDSEENYEEKKQEGSYKGFFDFFKEIIKVVVISAVIVIPIRYYLIQPFFVSGASMVPQFHNGEYLIIDEFSYRNNAPQRGDVVVFYYPKDPSQFYIKRIVGLPGETVQIKNEQVIIYDKNKQLYPWGLVLDETGYLKKGETTKGNVDLMLEDDQYFVLGDNRQASSDSRYWGTLDKKFIIGKVWVRAWPFDSVKIFSEQITY
ncbi:signal peptidase I [Patescibacteria group bacterium]|nr:signal peptidase I [Patescibacteria group bacterium]